jgi:ribosome-binding factor A
MPTHRPERVSERIHQELSLILDREISDPRLEKVNITRVEVSNDLRYARVFVSPRGKDTEATETMDALARAAGYFRRRLASSLDLRFAPEIRFQLDRSVEMGERFLQVLEQVQAEQRAAARGKRGRTRG